MVEIEWIQVDCPDGVGTSSNGSGSTSPGNPWYGTNSNSGNGNPNGNPNGNNSGGGFIGSGSAPSAYSPQTGILTSPVHGGNKELLEDLKSKLDFSLNEEQTKFLLEYSNFDFLNQLNNFSEVSQESDTQTFILQIIEQSILNPSLHFDIISSYNSPFNVDLKSLEVKPTDNPQIKTQKQKFNKIYNKLKISPDFKTLFIDLFQNNSDYNVKIQLASNLLDDQGNPVKGVTSLINNSNNSVLIQINSGILTTSASLKQTNIEISKTILHECIHAYLLIKALHPDAGMPIPNAQNMTVQQLINAIYPGTGDQHQFMYNNMLPTMENILNPLLNQLTTAPSRAECEAVPIDAYAITNPSAPSQIWNWSSYIHYLCIKGLEDCSSFQTDYPTNSDAQALFDEYTIIAHDLLDYNILP